MVTQTIRDLELQKLGEKGHYCRLYEDATGEGESKGVTLDCSRHSLHNKSAFIQALIDNFNSKGISVGVDHFSASFQQESAPMTS